MKRTRRRADQLREGANGAAPRLDERDHVSRDHVAGAAAGVGSRVVLPWPRPLSSARRVAIRRREKQAACRPGDPLIVSTTSADARAGRARLRAHHPDAPVSSAIGDEGDSFPSGETRAARRTQPWGQRRRRPGGAAAVQRVLLPVRDELKTSRRRSGDDGVQVARVPIGQRSGHGRSRSTARVQRLPRIHHGPEPQAAIGREHGMRESPTPDVSRRSRPVARSRHHRSGPRCRGSRRRSARARPAGKGYAARRAVAITGRARRRWPRCERPRSARC